MKTAILKTHVAPIKTKQSGLSLIELLIAMIIGLFLLAGITTSYLSSKKSSLERDQYSILEDNGRLALEVLTKTLEHTGYATPNNVPLEEDKLITAAINSSICSDGTQSVINPGIFSAVNFVTDDNDSGDRVGVVYRGDGNVFTDCSGGVLPATCGSPEKIYSAFYRDATDDTLKCAGSRDNDAQLIAEGIENIQILYGIDVDESPNKDVERYVNASAVNGLWDNVISIQVAVLARSLKAVKDKAEQQKFTLLDYEHTTPTDRYQRAVFSTTISLRNP